MFLDKKKKAMEIMNDAYGMGEYSKEQWLERKREKEIFEITDEINQIRKILSVDPKINNNKRKDNLSEFFANITNAANNSERNDLYKTIIDSIIWYRKENDISVKINFK